MPPEAVEALNDEMDWKNSGKHTPHRNDTDNEKTNDSRKFYDPFDGDGIDIDKRESKPGSSIANG